jgi:hypothetical protein
MLGGASAQETGVEAGTGEGGTGDSGAGTEAGAGTTNGVKGCVAADWGRTFRRKELSPVPWVAAGRLAVKG